MRRDGTVDAWYRDADPIVKQVAGGVNAPLLQQLLRECGHCDADVAEMFREVARSAALALAVFPFAPGRAADRATRFFWQRQS